MVKGIRKDAFCRYNVTGYRQTSRRLPDKAAGRAATRIYRGIKPSIIHL